MSLIPAIICRRLEGETPESFTDRQDTCRNEANRLGFHGPEKFGANLFDEDTFEAGVLDNIKKWPVIMVYDFADLADTRDELAERLRVIQAGGSNVISIREYLDPANPEVPTFIDLRGTDAASMAYADAFRIWMGLGATEATESKSISQILRENEQEDRKIEAIIKAQPEIPPPWTPEQKEAVRYHLAVIGNEKPAELGKQLGIHWAKAQAWLKYAAANPLPAEPDEQIPS